MYDNHARRGEIGHLPAEGCRSGDGHRAQAEGRDQAADEAPHGDRGLISLSSF